MFPNQRGPNNSIGVATTCGRNIIQPINYSEYEHHIIEKMYKKVHNTYNKYLKLLHRIGGVDMCHVAEYTERSKIDMYHTCNYIGSIYFYRRTIVEGGYYCQSKMISALSISLLMKREELNDPFGVVNKPLGRTPAYDNNFINIHNLMTKDFGQVEDVIKQCLNNILNNNN